MPANAKINPVQMAALLKSGLGQNEIARQLGVAKSSISKRVKKLPASRDPADVAAHEVMAKLPALKRLDRISKVIDEELSWIQSVIRTKEGEERITWEKIQLLHSEEIRKQLGLLREISLTLYNVQEVEKFRETVLAVLEDTDVALRDKVVTALKLRRTAGNILRPGKLKI